MRPAKHSFHAPPRGKSARRSLPFLLALLLALPLTVSAAGSWCAWLPWLPGCPRGGDGSLTEVRNFGTNPGNLQMFTYRPANLPAGRPLVVALHGCTQQASDYDNETGWIQFADRNRFALLLPQQQAANNPQKCFNWFLPEDNERDRGEALSIRQMIDKLKADAGSDAQRIYVTGLSGGGAMTSVMLAAYPDVFAGGAILAGVPYKCANDANEALNRCGVSMTATVAPMKNLTPAQWGDLVRNAAPRGARVPRISIWQGSRDTIVNPLDQAELVDQWTNALGIDQVPDIQDTIHGQAHKLYKDANGVALVETVLIEGMGHGTPVAPGNGAEQCGKAAPFILDVGICSSFYIVKFWGLDAP